MEIVRCTLYIICRYYVQTQCKHTMGHMVTTAACNYEMMANFHVNCYFYFIIANIEMILLEMAHGTVRLY